MGYQIQTRLSFPVSLFQDCAKWMEGEHLRTYCCGYFGNNYSVPERVHAYAMLLLDWHYLLCEVYLSFFPSILNLIIAEAITNL